MTNPNPNSQQENAALVSVIIPTYNRAHTLPRALHSVLSQAGVAFEVIIIDDASTDSTSQVLQEFHDPRVHCLRHPTHQGAAAARNTGIRASHGAWLAFLDSDDEWLPGLLDAQMQRFQVCDPQVGVVFTSFQRIQGKHCQRTPGPVRALFSLLPFERYHLSGNLTQALQRGNFITLQTTLIRRICFGQVGLFNESLPRLQDWEFWLRLSPLYNFAWINQPLVRVYASVCSISSAAPTLPDALKIILEKHSTGAPELTAHCHFILGDYLMQTGNLSQGRTHLWQALRGSPTTLLYWAAGLSAAMHPIIYRYLSARLGFGYTRQ